VTTDVEGCGLVVWTEVLHLFTAAMAILLDVRNKNVEQWGDRQWHVLHTKCRQYQTVRSNAILRNMRRDRQTHYLRVWDWTVCRLLSRRPTASKLLQDRKWQATWERRVPRLHQADTCLLPWKRVSVLLLLVVATLTNCSLVCIRHCSCVLLLHTAYRLNYSMNLLSVYFVICSPHRNSVK
jgi:hypothetical protein